MGPTDVESASQQPENTVTQAPAYRLVPKKRKKRARRMSVIMCAITAILVITFCLVNRTVVEYHPNTRQKNTTTVYYIKKDKLGFPGLFTAALGLFGVVLGTLVDRLSLVNEECHHLKRRYGGSWRKMTKACFSGIKWGPVIVLLGSTAVIVVILIFATDKPWFELNYLVIIFSGIGLGPLIVHLLNLNTQSEVHIYTFLEENEMHIANGLAWSYYLNYLKQALPKFQETTSYQFPAPHQNIKLTSTKLLLLLPVDCDIVRDVNELDTSIRKLFDTGNDQDPFRFPVYCLTDSQNKERYYVIQNIKEPLNTLREIIQNKKIKAVKESKYEEEINLLCRTLSGILRNPPNPEFRETCQLILYERKTAGKLRNGGLVSWIMKETQRRDNEPDGALRVAILEDNNRRHSNPTDNDEKSEGTEELVDPRHKQNDGSRLKIEKTKKKTPKRKKPKTSDDSMRHNILTDEEGSDNDDDENMLRSEKRRSIPEVGHKNASGAGTSGIINNAYSKQETTQSGQHYKQSSNNETKF